MDISQFFCLWACNFLSTLRVLQAAGVPFRHVSSPVAADATAMPSAGLCPFSSLSSESLKQSTFMKFQWISPPSSNFSAYVNIWHLPKTQSEGAGSLHFSSMPTPNTVVVWTHQSTVAGRTDDGHSSGISYRLAFETSAIVHLGDCWNPVYLEVFVQCCTEIQSPVYIYIHIKGHIRGLLPQLSYWQSYVSLECALVKNLPINALYIKDLGRRCGAHVWAHGHVSLNSMRCNARKERAEFRFGHQVGWSSIY